MSSIHTLFNGLTLPSYPASISFGLTQPKPRISTSPKRRQLCHLFLLFSPFSTDQKACFLHSSNQLLNYMASTYKISFHFYHHYSFQDVHTSHPRLLTFSITLLLPPTQPHYTILSFSPTPSIPHKIARLIFLK